MTYNRTPHRAVSGNQQPRTDSMSDPGPLAKKLRSEFLRRGQSLYGVSAASTEELVDRAQRGYDPGENVSEVAFSDRVRNPGYTYAAKTTGMYRGQPSPSHHTGKYSPGQASRSEHTGTGRFSHSSSYQTNYERSGVGYGNRREDTDIRTGKKTADHDKAVRRAKKKAARKRMQEELKQERQAEVIVSRRKMPVGYICTLILVTAMVMSILLSIAQIYQTTGTIDALENELNKLQDTAAELELAVEEKNDIRIIEQIATDQLGMVKEDSVQRKYISLSDGERIDIIGDTEQNDTQSLFGTMLSSIAAALGDFFDNLS